MTFAYDPFGRRIEKASSAGTSIYAYDGDNLVEETNSSGAVVARYSQGLNIDEPLAMLRSATTSFYEADGLGTVTSLTGTAGALAQTYTFDSFGKQTASSGSLTNPFQYTGREFDPETSLYYYRARYYDPTTGRFLSEDPLRFRGGANFYSYADNRPVLLRDPTGRIAWGGGIVGSAGGGVFWFGGGGEGSFYLVADSLGNQGILSCSGFGIGAVAGASASVQAGSVVCPNCKSICDMQGNFGGAQAFGGVGANGAAGGGASISKTSATIFTSAGVGVGVGGGLVAIGGSCTLIWKEQSCPSCSKAAK